MSMCSFSFNSYADHRDLHSSLHDALPISTPGSDSGRMISRKIWNGVAPMSRAASSRLRSIFASEKKIGPTRSEEHTSELQSLTNLVCRLLLEKKKKKKNTHNEDHDKQQTK